MSSRPIYAVCGLIIGAVVDLAINLLASAIQQREFLNHFSDQALWGLAGLALVGLLVGYWMGSPLQLSKPSSSASASPESPETVTLTRFRALLSYGRLKGKGIHLRDILLIGSRMDIET
jgi:hypothetical protein